LLMMLHPTQELEPPANPARFSSSRRRSDPWERGRHRPWDGKPPSCRGPDQRDHLRR